MANESPMMAEGTTAHASNKNVWAQNTARCRDGLRAWWSVCPCSHDSNRM